MKNRWQKMQYPSKELSWPLFFFAVPSKRWINWVFTQFTFVESEKTGKSGFFTLNIISLVVINWKVPFLCFYFYEKKLGILVCHGTTWGIFCCAENVFAISAHSCFAETPSVQKKDGQMKPRCVFFTSYSLICSYYSCCCKTCIEWGRLWPTGDSLWCSSSCTKSGISTKNSFYSEWVCIKSWFLHIWTHWFMRFYWWRKWWSY